jgi:NAD(P)-dependent dehydrogenase (short-subunit alcohol dehydrogenase family)
MPDAMLVGAARVALWEGMDAQPTTLITGASGAIGRTFAETLGREGWRLRLLDVNAGALAETAAALGGDVRTAVADVSDRAALEAAVAGLLGADGRLALLVSCAAVLGPGTWATQPADAFERVLRVDFLGTANVIRACLPALRRARGQAVLLASTAAVHGWPGLAAYSAAKFAVVGYSEGIRAELATDGVGVTTVFPLLIDTPLLQGADIPPILRRGRRLPPDAVVRKVLRAARRRRARVYVPGSVRVLQALHGLAPSLLDWYGKRFGLERR